MTDPVEIKGQCLCGAVQVRAKTSAPRLRACHCDMCRQHTSGAFVSLETIAGSQQIDGVTAQYQSSSWAHRGFCPICGSTLWSEPEGSHGKVLSAGLFPNAGGGTLKVEFFADQCPQGYGFAGDQTKLNTDETLALFAPKEGTDT